MRWPAQIRNEDGFTLPELMISMVIMSLLIVAIGGALIVSLKTTGSTEQRIHESQDVLITSSYVANDVQSSASVNVNNAATNCAGAFTTLVTFTYASAAHPTAVYKCGTANGETQVTRTFNSGTPIVVAHFAGISHPTVTVDYDTSTPPVPMSVTMRFTKPSDCTLDCVYTLFGSRRNYNPASVTSGGTPLPADVVLLSTGVASPLWVQGACPDPGTTVGCIIDPTKTALPISDAATTDWSPTPLWTRLSDADATTFVSSAAGKKTEAKVRLGSVDPPDTGVTPTVEFHGASLSGALKVSASIYDANNLSTPLVTNANIGNVNQSKNYDWALTAAEAALIPTAAYAHLAIGFWAPNAKGTDSLQVDGIALDTLDLSSVGLLTVKGPLYINSQLSAAVRLTGQKTATKISIINGGDFRIWAPGACSGCNHNTVACAACTWVGNQPWTSYTTSIPDPLRSLPAPPIPSAGSCTAGVCTPGSYNNFSFTSDTQLEPGVYYLTNGMSISGSAGLTCPTCTGGQGVLLYIAGGAVQFTGSAKINLPAATTGLYKGILMFQARTDTNPVKIAGNSGSSVFCTMGGVQYGNCLDGIVYVPNSTMVTLATGTSSLATKAVVSQNIKVSSSVTIG